ncbi:MAG: septum formation inhibitor Maf [Gemmatimonadaceae bacterium]|nr:septum formation inhibitor Maf [Gemmatimonadaceae bacterium]
MISPRVILASSSPRRRELLDLVGIGHEVIPADIDETYRDGEEAAPHALRLAREKGATIAVLHPEAVVISADTIVVVDGLVLGKPRDEADAARMLSMLGGQTHVVLTAVAVSYRGKMHADVESVRVTFRSLDTERIGAYVATGEPMDKAGSYGIQGFGATLIERVDGDYFAVMGLPLARMVDLLQEIGVRYEFGALLAPPSA